MKTIKLSETKGMLKVIAQAKLKHEKEYFCVVNNEKTRIIKG